MYELINLVYYIIVPEHVTEKTLSKFLKIRDDELTTFFFGNAIKIKLKSSNRY